MSQGCHHSAGTSRRHVMEERLCRRSSDQLPLGAVRRHTPTVVDFAGSWSHQSSRCNFVGRPAQCIFLASTSSHLEVSCGRSHLRRLPAVVAHSCCSRTTVVLSCLPVLASRPQLGVLAVAVFQPLVAVFCTDAPLGAVLDFLHSF